MKPFFSFITYLESILNMIKQYPELRLQVCDENC